MRDQNFNNHIRYYPAHHFVFYPVGIAMLIFSACNIYKYPAQRIEWIAIAVVTLLLIWLSFMVRQHYALTCQNRIVRLELRVRYHQLTGQRLEPFEEQLGFGRLAALRFASDEELPALLKRTLEENLTSADIKKSIRNWNPDHMRV